METRVIVEGDSMFESCLAKQQQVRELFAQAATQAECYQVLLDLGKKQPRLLPEEKTEQSRIHGCQSLTYLTSSFDGGMVYIRIESDALISAGLGQLLTMVYSGECPEAILKCPPTFLDDLGLRASLTPGRANGLDSMFSRIQQVALQYLLSSPSR